MTAVLRIQGVPYHSIADVEKAVKDLAAEISILPEDSDAREKMAHHVGELLAAIPDENASALLQLIAGTSGVDPDALDNADDEPARVIEVHRSVADNVEDAPVCPMCMGDGILATEPPQDPTAERCPACQGYGNVYTGSRVDGHTTRNCPTCNGNGYISKTSEFPLPPPAQVAAAAPVWPLAGWNPTTQRWDPPEGNPPWDGAVWDEIKGNYIS